MNKLPVIVGILSLACGIIHIVIGRSDESVAWFLAGAGWLGMQAERTK
jgi:hypothetical protein